jgi:RNA polymerase sigma-70 factor (ECF subfamily)
MTTVDHQLYEDLVRAHSAAIYRFAFRLCGDRDMADDLVQETFCEAWRSIDSLRDPGSGKSWLFQILRHRNAHGVRSRSRRVQTHDDIEQLNRVIDSCGPDVLAKLSDQEILQRAMDSLDERNKEPFLLVFQEDFTCREVAEILDIPLGTVLSRIHRARQSLRRFIRQVDPDVESEVVGSQAMPQRKGES